MAVNLNDCLLSGTVMEDPQILGEGENRWVFVKLMTYYERKDDSGKFSEYEQPVQIVSDDSRHVNTIEKYVKKGKAVTFYTFYREWQAQGSTFSGFFIRKMKFASANWGSSDQNQGPPSLPNG